MSGDLLGFLDGLGIEVQVLEDLVDAIDKRYPDEGGGPDEISALIDPLTAEASWLPWVAMLYGVLLDRQGPVSFTNTYGQLAIDYATYTAIDVAFASYSDLLAAVTAPGLTELEQRMLIAARPGWRAGSTGAIRRAVQQYLTGTQAVEFNRNDGHWAAVEVVTYEDETPYPWRVERYLELPDVAPAYVVLTHAVAPGAP